MQIPYLYFSTKSPFRQEWYDIILTIYIWIVTCYGELDDATTNEAFCTSCINMVTKASEKIQIDNTLNKSQQQLQLFQFYLNGIEFFKNEFGGKYYKSFRIAYLFTALCFTI